MTPHSTLAPAALHPPRHRRARRDGLPRPALPARAPPLHPNPGRHLPHPLLRRAHPPPGPHHSLAHRRPDHHTNGAGLCEACNHTKETPGWKARPVPMTPRSGSGARHTIELTTPTGHTYTPPRHPCREHRFAYQPLRPAARPGSRRPAPAPAPGEGSQDPQTRCPLRRPNICALKVPDEPSPAKEERRRRVLQLDGATSLPISAPRDPNVGSGPRPGASRSGTASYDNRAGSVLGLKEGRVASYAVMSGSRLRVSPMSSRPSRRRHRCSRQSRTAPQCCRTARSWTRGPPSLRCRGRSRVLSR